MLRSESVAEEIHLQAAGEGQRCSWLTPASKESTHCLSPRNQCTAASNMTIDGGGGYSRVIVGCSLGLVHKDVILRERLLARQNQMTGDGAQRFARCA